MSNDKQDNIKEFLSEYATFIKEAGDSWKEYAPFHTGLCMASGTVFINDKNNKTLIWVSSGYDPKGNSLDHPAMPVMPHAIELNKIICEFLNQAAKETAAESPGTESPSETTTKRDRDTTKRPTR